MTGPWQELARARAASGEQLVLRCRGDEYEIRCDGWELMSSRAQHSEQELARLACAGLAGAARVLIGGLGLGYTLRATLDVLPAAARVTVAEIFAEVIAWNRGPLADLAGRPLDDSRVSVARADVVGLLRPGAWHAILLDTDNGPDATMLAGNAGLYAAPGLARLRAALAPGGRLAVWSAGPSAGFEARLAGSFGWEGRDVPARGRTGDPLHALYLATPLATASD